MEKLLCGPNGRKDREPRLVVKTTVENRTGLAKLDGPMNPVCGTGNCVGSVGTAPPAANHRRCIVATVRKIERRISLAF
jgi:hypothetical protein